MGRFFYPGAGMNKIAVVSGKGGTGKTFLTSALTAIPKRQVIIDCDVDASNLYLLLDPENGNPREFYSGKTAEIDSDLCIDCDECRVQCRYDAISTDYTIDPFLCEGCSLCYHICPVNAIRMVSEKAGDFYQTETSLGPFIYANMTPGGENSGKLVAKLKEVGKKIAKDINAEYTLLDGPPGISCPLISTIAGCQAAVIVTEPTRSGLHDLGRVHDVVNKFNTKAGVVINKYDLSPEQTEEIEKYCTANEIPLLGKIPYSTIIAETLSRGDMTFQNLNGSIKREVDGIWEQLLYLLNSK